MSDVERKKEKKEGMMKEKTKNNVSDKNNLHDVEGLSFSYSQTFLPHTTGSCRENSPQKA
jgi:hypothetical protein